MTEMIRIGPYQYIHVFDSISNVTRVEIGPSIYTPKDNEKIILNPTNMIKLPQQTYCIIENPRILKNEKELSYIVFPNGAKEVELNRGIQEIRKSEEFLEPFPLYPGEVMVQEPRKYDIIGPNAALVLEAKENFEDSEKNKRSIGDRWLFIGPKVYYPDIKIKVIEERKAYIIKQGSALKVKAIQPLIDLSKKSRSAGDVYLIKEAGAYILHVHEEIVAQVVGQSITLNKAIWLRSLSNFVDAYGTTRKIGEEWLVLPEMTDFHVLDVNEELLGGVYLTVLNSRQYCVICNPVEKSGKRLNGLKLLKKGETSFFLRPGEKLENGIQEMQVLQEDESLILQANKDFIDDELKERKAGFKWSIDGPREYIPPIEVTVISKRKAIPLDENEGVYIRDLKTGKVELIQGPCTHRQGVNEILWEKELEPTVEDILMTNGGDYVPATINSKGEKVYTTTAVKGKTRDKTKAVVFTAPHNSVVQIFDYRSDKLRYVFGPGKVMLSPYEDVTVVSLSGGIPKKENLIKSISLKLGPDFITDEIIVETMDHAKLKLRMSYNWLFNVDKNDVKSCKQIFNINDFVGHVCSTVASRVRGIISQKTFEQFHQNSTHIIRSVLFKNNQPILLKENNLSITNIDIQSVEPVDEDTRKSLERSVTLSIEIATKSQEESANHEANQRKEMHKASLKLEEIKNNISEQDKLIDLIKLENKSLAIQASGKLKAEATALAEKIRLTGESLIKKTGFEMAALKLQNDHEIEIKTKRYDQIEKETKETNDLEVKYAEETTNIEIEKFKKMVNSMGKSTMVAMAEAGPAAQAELLKGLGLQGYMVIDGKNPINLMGLATGMVGSKPTQ